MEDGLVLHWLEVESCDKAYWYSMVLKQNALLQHILERFLLQCDTSTISLKDASLKEKQDK